MMQIKLRKQERRRLRRKKKAAKLQKILDERE